MKDDKKKDSPALPNKDKTDFVTLDFVKRIAAEDNVRFCIDVDRNIIVLKNRNNEER